MTTTDATDATFDAEVLQSDLPVVVDFWAEWCQPCKRMSPILEEIAAEHAGRIKVVKLDTDENPAMTMKYRITGIPAFKVFVNGEEVKEIVGAMPKPVFERELAEYLG